MGEETEHRGDTSQDKGDDMKNKSISDPFDDNLRDLDDGVVPKQRVNVYKEVIASLKGWRAENNVPSW